MCSLLVSSFFVDKTDGRPDPTRPRLVAKGQGSNAVHLSRGPDGYLYIVDYGGVW
jgi:hypothetical protein